MIYQTPMQKRKMYNRYLGAFLNVSFGLVISHETLYNARACVQLLPSVSTLVSHGKVAIRN